MDREKILELQSYFDGRKRLNNALTAIKSYTKDSSLFFGYTDGFKNKKTVNIPIEPEELIPILEGYIENIDKEILNIANEKMQIKIINTEALMSQIQDFRNSYPDTYTDYPTIEKILIESYDIRKENNNFLGQYHIEVCSDWQQQLYIFFLDNVFANQLTFRFEGIYKL